MSERELRSTEILIELIIIIVIIKLLSIIF